MTNKEARNILLTSIHPQTSEEAEAIGIAVKAVEKMIPKKPTKMDQEEPSLPDRRTMHRVDQEEPSLTNRPSRTTASLQKTMVVAEGVRGRRTPLPREAG